MSQSSEIYTSRINTTVHISLSSISHRSPRLRLTCDDASTTFSRLESYPTSSRGTIDPSFSSSVRRGSLTLIVRPPISSTSTCRLSTSNGTHYSTSAVSHAHDRHLARQDTGVFVESSGWSGRRRRDAPAPPRLPDYAAIEPPPPYIEPPPPYNPEFLAPTNGRGWSGAVGRGPSSTPGRCPPPPPPSRSSVTSPSSLPVVAEQRMMIPVSVYEDDDDDDVFFTEKPTTLEHGLKTRF